MALEMNQKEEVRSSPVEKLPVELLQEVLECLPDVPSLYAAILSCSSFHSAFIGAECAISTAVLFNQIKVEVLPEAMIACDSALLRPHDPNPKSRETILNFVTCNFLQRPTGHGLWPLWKALHLGRLHFYVDALAKEFAVSALSKSPLNQLNRLPARQESCRIERTLYRFEIYCNIFRENEKRFSSSPSTVLSDRKRLFFDNFTPYENEQLGCIHDFLIQIVSPSFNEVAEHDVYWGAANVEYDNAIDNGYVQAVLSRGLEKIYKISRAETYDERYGVLNANECPHHNRGFLYEGLEEEANEPYNDNVYVEDITPVNERLYIKQPFFNDLDRGPMNAWRWAHVEETRSNWVYQQNRKELREWGYVLWDQSRLDAVGILHERWEDTVSVRDLVLEQQEAGREHAYMQNSWIQREKVSRAGGSGWWSWGDRSKLKWRTSQTFWNRSGYSRSSPELKPTSLQQAREMISSIMLPASASRYHRS
ncbi:hypothetical protein F5Y03DRAFT_126745 [Xylaria venustula]|nr:hypothetical protein F5Y03DRAFT_126745 [Xylaria venustula]